eukprot:CAMPEP_0117081830 /NCGR_PEP_ID=MMETSP0472-20121206/57653_1 /TAXON_ID=693140 ORGANISM="Tiarina fusus, Strain LIS" /NCGR_SAMPLE_ID=MMETSP0472 /ASSEMBLY_ACC=CAM_ASM_000603 /LENGTH=165 /DNA_ID=CAMNT_0004809877 /DNA_START=24 /DNA_END=519 /DNA_ORIENTATION=-
MAWRFFDGTYVEGGKFFDSLSVAPKFGSSKGLMTVLSNPAFSSSVASFGFATFGTACTGLVLKNYSTQDPLMSLSRIAVLLSLLFSYPLAFVGVRDGILDLLQVQDRPNSLLNSVTVGLLTLITGMAYFLSDLRKLLAFNGATWGNAVIYLLPTYMFVQCAKNVK